LARLYIYWSPYMPQYKHKMGCKL